MRGCICGLPQHHSGHGDCEHGPNVLHVARCEDKREISRLTEQRNALLAACEAAEYEMERLKDCVCEEDRESICGVLGILASARLRARGGDRA